MPAECHNGWSDAVMKTHVEQQLRGEAARVLMTTGSADWTLTELLDALQNRLGNEGQASRYRDLLHTRRRRKGESLADLYTDIGRLALLAYPGPINAVVEALIVEAFCNSLADDDLGHKVRDREPETVDMAFRVAVHLEARTQSQRRRQGETGALALETESDEELVPKARREDKRSIKGNGRSEQPSKPCCQRRPRRQQPLGGGASGDNHQQLIRKLSADLEETKEVIRQLQQRLDSAPAAAAPPPLMTLRPVSSVDILCYGCGLPGHIKANCPNKAPATNPLSASDHSFVPDAPRPANFGNNLQCYRCGEMGHTARYCISEKVLPRNPAPQSANSYSCSVDQPSKSRTCLSVSLPNLTVPCAFLLDTGSEHSVLPLGYCLNMHLAPVHARLFAANGTNIPVLGECTMLVTVGELTLPCQFWVTEHVSTGILGIDFMHQHNVYWDVARGEVEVKGHKVVLTERQQVNTCYQLVAQYEMPLPTATETSVVDQGVCVVHGLWSPRCTDLPVCLMNVTQGPISIQRGQDIAGAEQVQVVGAGVTESGTLEFIDKHGIDTGMARPFRQPLRPPPRWQQDEIDRQLQERERNDLIEPSQSSWASNLVVVAKKDGSLHLCTDSHALNSVTRKDTCSSPNISECPDALGTTKSFSVFDLQVGHNQVKLVDEAKDETSCVTKHGTFKVMSFGLCHALAMFQRLLDVTLAGLNFRTLLVYLDDIIVFSETAADHFDQLRQLFDCLRHAGLKLRPSKSKLFQKVVEFQGHIVSREGIRTDPHKVEAVRDWPRPVSVKEVRSCLGLASYNCHFVPEFATIAAPLHALTHKYVQFKWMTECEESIGRLKRALITSPVQSKPLDEGRFHLDTDACNDSIGAVLQQEQGGEKKVVAYASRLLRGAEENHCVTREEPLAIVVHVKQFRNYLLGRPFTVRTDHSIPQSRTSEPIGQQGRWLEVLGQYQFDILHRAGKQPDNADALSRRPCHQCQLDTPATVTPEVAVTASDVTVDVTAAIAPKRDTAAVVVPEASITATDTPSMVVPEMDATVPDTAAAMVPEEGTATVAVAVPEAAYESVKEHLGSSARRLKVVRRLTVVMYLVPRAAKSNPVVVKAGKSKRCGVPASVEPIATEFADERSCEGGIDCSRRRSVRAVLSENIELLTYLKMSLYTLWCAEEKTLNLRC